MPEQHDPIRDLETFGTGGLRMTPIPPGEVRRLGDRRRARRRTAGIAVAAVAVVAATVPVAVLAIHGDGGTSTPPAILTSPTPTATATSTVITYPEPGIDVSSAADTAKLEGTTAEFKSFIADQARKAADDGAACPGAAHGVTVQKYSSAGYALGGVNSCGGYEALWVMDQESGRWHEGLGTQDSWDCDGLRYLGVPSSFAGDCYDYSGSFGPQEVDGLRIGMSRAQIQAAGGTVLGDPTVGCSGIRRPHSTQVEGQGDGFFSSSDGLVALAARPGDKTDKKIGLGSTEAAFKAAYPNAATDVYGHWSVPLADGNAYFVGLGDGIVNQMLLVGPHRNSTNPLPLCLG